MVHMLTYTSLWMESADVIVFEKAKCKSLRKMVCVVKNRGTIINVSLLWCVGMLNGKDNIIYLLVFPLKERGYGSIYF